MPTSINIAISPYHDPYLNIAIERYFLLHAKQKPILYLWSNNPCVILGRNQNIYQECQLDYIQKHHILPVRRYSGGGCVYQDLGNLNFTYITNENIAEEIIIQDLINILHTLNIQATKSGRNDLLVNDQKISGMAYTIENNHLMYHGTLLIDVFMTHLVQALKPHPYKLQSHAITSVRSRVTNLKELYPINQDMIIQAFLKYYSHDILPIEINQEIKQLYQQIKDPLWIYNDCPDFDITLDKKTSQGYYQFQFKIENGIIQDVHVFHDHLDDITLPTNIFLNIPFDVQKIKDIITKIVL